MPSKNVIKEYESGAYYHIYNRGVEKRIIFEDEHDYSTFLSLLKLYLTSPSLPGESLKVKRPPSHHINNFNGNISVIAYCLMPNHFHLMVKQSEADGINHFMRSLSTQYVHYFNKKYSRIGCLFQGPYKAVKVVNENQFTYLTKYIHRNPLDLPAFRESPGRLSEYKYSSYGNYLKHFHQAWINPENILTYFSSTNPHCSYKNFVEETSFDDTRYIAPIAIDI